MLKTMRPRGVMLRLLDLHEVVEYATEHARKEDEAKGDTRPSKVRLGSDPYAATEHDGRVYVVCHEGVGWEVTDTDPMRFDVFVEHQTASGWEMSILPSFMVTMGKDGVLAAATGPETDLADLVREFGARLETNHAVWYRTLGGAVRGSGK